MTITRYTSENKQEWDEFVRQSKNGTFLLERGYMDYHSDRFEDYSLMYRDEKGRLIAVLPANVVTGEEDSGMVATLYSHQGLTYGGFILAAKGHAVDVKEMFEATMSYLCNCGIGEWYYKPVPQIFHNYPSQEDEYWLWRVGAKKVMCNLSCVVDMKSEITGMDNARKKSYHSKLKRLGYTIDYDCSLESFWPILETNLHETYDAKPVHSLEEIMQLKRNFPDNIICCVVRNAEGEVEAGTVLFINRHVVHTQYISASKEGKRTKAVDYLVLELLDMFRSQERYKYFDFGTSNEQNGRILNESLILQKEGFGGRGITYNGYLIKLKSE